MDSSTTDSIVALRRALISNGYVPIRLLTNEKFNREQDYLERAHAAPKACLQEDGSHLNTGISCRCLRVIDIDCDDANFVKQIRSAAEKHIGAGAVRYRANSHKIAMVYRAVDGSQGIISVGGIEVRGNGHILAYGRHPSGAVLQWERDQGPAEWGLQALNPATMHDILAFLDDVCEILGCDYKHRRPYEKGLRVNQEFPRWTIDDIKAALELIPNELTPGLADDRAMWRKIGAAVYVAADGDEEALEFWIEWSTKNENFPNDESVCRKEWADWHRKPPHSIKPGSLVYHVREAKDDDSWLPASWGVASVIDEDPKDGDPEVDNPIDADTDDGHQDPPSPDPTTTAKDKRPGIRCIQGRRHEIVDRAEKLLIEAGVPIYRRSGMLVTPKLEPQKDREGRTVNAMILAPVTLDGLLTEMTRIIRWRVAKKVDRKTVWVTADAPPVYGNALLAGDRNWTFPRIIGVLTAPTLRSDGSLLNKPGFDPATGMYLVDTNWGRIHVKERPTREDALDKLKFLHKFYRQIPFVGDLVEGKDGIWCNEAYDPRKPNVSRSVADSLMIAPVIPLLVPKSPVHAVLATDYGSGKTYIDDLSHNTLTGINCSVTNASVKDEELTKVLDAHAYKGSQFICLDNATHSIRNVRLSQIASQDMIEIRVLGLSKNLMIAYSPFITINGNNVPPDRDMKRRMVICYLDAQMARPYLRQFKGDHRKTIRRIRGRVISAILTMVRAYIVAEMPNKGKRLAQYDHWSDHVASMLVWLGEANPILSIEAISENDSEENNINDVMDELERELLKREPNKQEPSKQEPSNGTDHVDIVSGFTFRASEFLNYVNRRHDWHNDMGMKSDLYLALSSMCKTNSGGIDAQAFGMLLKRINGQIHNGRRFRKIEKVGKSNASNLWAFERVPSGVDGKVMNIKDLRPYQDALKLPVEHLEEHQRHQKTAQKAIDDDENHTRH